MNNEKSDKQVYVGPLKSSLEMRTKDIELSMLTEQLLLKSFEALASKDPAIVALGIEYLGKWNNKIHSEMDPSWTQEKNIAWQSRLVESILRASSGEKSGTTSTSSPTGPSEKRVGFSAWNTDQKQEFSLAVSGLGIIPPNPPATPPTPGGTPTAGK